MIYGVGINDRAGVSTTRLYRVWSNMLKRCYDPEYQAKYPTYVGCTVCNAWHRLSVFWEWAKSRWAPGLCLDKDLMIPGNRVYGPETCCFVSEALNNLLTDSGAARGPWPIGVLPWRKRFRAHCSVEGILKHLGTFDSPEEAHAVYVRVKVRVIRAAMAEQDDARIAIGLEHHARILEASVQRSAASNQCAIRLIRSFR